MSLIRNDTWSRKVSYDSCHSAQLNPNGAFILLPGETYNVDFQIYRNESFPVKNPSKLSFKRQTSDTFEDFKLTSLNPYFDGKNCTSNTNCYSCTSDYSCQWCAGKCGTKGQKCVDSSVILRPEECSNCSSYLSCSECLSNVHPDGLCEWSSQEARCIRRGRFENSISDLEQCPDECHVHQGCNECLEDHGQCVWCESTQVS